MAVPVLFAGEYPEEGAGGVCRYLLRTHPTDERSLASCLCMKESIDGSNGLLWHPYAFVWRSSEGVRGDLRAGSTGIRCDALAIRRLGLLRTKTKKLRGGHEGIRIGPPAGRVGRGRTSMADTRRAGARRCFRNRRFRYVTRAAGRGQRCRNGGYLEGTGNRKEPKQNPGNRMISTVSGVPIRAEDTRFCAECEKSLIFRQFSRLQGDDATVIPTVYTGQHVPSSSATVNSTIIPIVVCMTLKQLPMARSALQEGRLSCQQRSLLGIWNLSP